MTPETTAVTPEYLLIDSIIDPVNIGGHTFERKEVLSNYSCCRSLLEKANNKSPAAKARAARFCSSCCELGFGQPKDMSLYTAILKAAELTGASAYTIAPVVDCRYVRDSNE